MDLHGVFQEQAEQHAHRHAQHIQADHHLRPMVRERLLQLTSEHIRFVLDGLRNLRTDVKNLKKYLLTMLFNAPVTLNGRTMLDVRKSVGGGFRPMLA